MNRRDRILAGLELARPGLEVGPLDRPLVRPEDGPVEYVDCADRAALAERYAEDPGVDTERLAEVHHVWGAQTLAEAVEGRAFHYVVASHVIEHVPDVVGWLREVAEVLVPHGVLALAIPDKRFTFDVDRPVSSLGEWLEAEAARARRPTLRQVLDSHLAMRTVDKRARWRGEDGRGAHHLSGLGAAEALAERVRGGEYVDAHCTVYTPEVFVELYAAAARLFDLPFALELTPTPPGWDEFFVTATRLADGDPGRASARDASIERARAACEAAIRPGRFLRLRRKWRALRS